MVVSPDLTLEQAAEIAAVSCAHATKITQISLSTTEGYGENGRVDSVIAEDSCIDESALVRFAQMCSAMNDLLEQGYVGEFYVEGIYGPDGRLSEAPAELDGHFGLRAGAAEEEMLIVALRAIHTRISDSSLEFTGYVSENGTLLSPTENTLTARLSPDTKLDKHLPFVNTLFSGWRHSVAVTDNSVAVQVSNSLNLASQQLRDLIAQGEASGIEVWTRRRNYRTRASRHRCPQRRLR
ncbi:hypothetical protein [Leucobacter denitrificans]|uniref:Uncharacterized protein n=1 Tax=Leucobacter denitrificans TaxID=683042 RepID=A0A7G9S6W7_9MICO|nr:hypothetical protein [Leucobacter denitrificans]QNN63592.1 hypothetical protein H9L06_04595 [Leucobacter denitrificans]